MEGVPVAFGEGGGGVSATAAAAPSTLPSEGWGGKYA